MSSSLPSMNAVAAIRVSTTKQGTDGDSPEAQREQIENFAKTRGIIIKKYFVFLESASKEQQPMQEAIDYCKNPRNNIQAFVIKSIDRFTRGGSYSYDHLKLQLDICHVALVDIYGVISSQQINTLDHLGFEYKWSKFSPSKKSEMLEAERAKDELRDIMSRMIGAEIRYTKAGFWMRQPPFGFVSEKIETGHGKRCVLRPHPEESKLIRRMFELRAKGTLSEQQIADELNTLGFRTRITYFRSTADRTKVIGKRGGKLLEPRKIVRYVQNPIYAGIIMEKWTNDKPVKAAFDGIVSIEAFNQANRNKVALEESVDGDFEYVKQQPAKHLINKGVRNDIFPYKRFVTCPTCHNSLLGSASRGKLGKYYPAYHCSNHGHYFRIPKKEFDETIVTFVKSLVVDPSQTEALSNAVLAVWEKKQTTIDQDEKALESRINELKASIRVMVDKIKLVSSTTAISFMEQDIQKTEAEIAELEEAKSTLRHDAEKVDMNKAMAYVKYFMEHLEELLIDLCNPIVKAKYFSVLFDVAPTYQEIKDGTLKKALLPGVNELFLALNCDNSLLVIPRGIEPLLPG